MSFDQLIQQGMVLGANLFIVFIWAWTIAMLIGAAAMIFRSRGNERLFGIMLAIVVLMALPTLIEDYPPTLAQASDNSWDKTTPYLVSLSNKIINTINSALGSTTVTADADPVPSPAADSIPPTSEPGGSPTPIFEDLPPRPPGPDGETGGDEEMGGGVMGGGAVATEPPTPTLAPTTTPEPTAVASPTPDLKATVLAVETPTPTGEPGWPPTPILMTPEGQ